MAFIYCPECGAQISDTASFCPQCGKPISKHMAPAAKTPVTTVQTPPSSSKVCPETHLAKAIVVTILCCWPIGIPAIVNAAAVSNEFVSGNYDVAVQKSENAKKWCNYTIIAGVVFWVLYIAVIAICAIVGAL